MSRRKGVIGSLLSGWLALATSSCGYTLQNSHSPLLEKEGIRKIYITPLVNNTYKTGVENLVYNSLLKTISAHRRVTVVTAPEEADALLNGSVTFADTTPGPAAVFKVGGKLKGVDRVLTTQYNARLACTFVLLRRNPNPKQAGIVWQGAFDRNKPFVSAVQVGTNGETARGETTALINDSEFDRSLVDLAGSMVADVHESMLAMF